MDPAREGMPQETVTHRRLASASAKSASISETGQASRASARGASRRASDERSTPAKMGALDCFGDQHLRVVKKDMVFEESAGVLRDGIEQPTDCRPRLAVERVAMRRSDDFRSRCMDMGVDGEGGDVYRPLSQARRHGHRGLRRSLERAAGGGGKRTHWSVHPDLLVNSLRKAIAASRPAKSGPLSISA